MGGLGHSKEVPDRVSMLAFQVVFTYLKDTEDTTYAHIHKEAGIFLVLDPDHADGTHPRMTAFCSEILEKDSLPMTIGEPTAYTDIIISRGPGCRLHLRLTVSAGGAFTYRLPSFQLGESCSLSFSAAKARVSSPYVNAA